LKYTGKWEKLKQWYNYLLAGFVFAIIPVAITTFGSKTGLTLLPGIDAITLLLWIVAVIFAIIGSAGMFKKLVWN
jgi:hypothetical protein